MTRHPLDTELPPLTRTTFEVAAARNDATRDLAPAGLHLVPPLAAYDIHAKLINEIRVAHSASSPHEWFNGRESGLRTAYRIVFGENAP
jgi:hypothetical protein